MLRCPRSVWENKTLRELVIEHDAYQIDRWWHTAFITCQLNNIQILIYNAFGGKNKLKPKSPSDFHPFIKPKARGIKITADNISILKALGTAMCKKS